MRDLGKLIVAEGLKKLPKVQKIAQSGHTEQDDFINGMEIFAKEKVMKVRVSPSGKLQCFMKCQNNRKRQFTMHNNQNCLNTAQIRAFFSFY